EAVVRWACIHTGIHTRSSRSTDGREVCACVLHGVDDVRIWIHLHGVDDVRIWIHLHGVDDVRIWIHLHGVDDVRIWIHLHGVDDVRIWNCIAREERAVE
ncbi:hypothetical protein VOLCADRAFT_81322, partial [Volvox carteri f. nagariensis]